MKPFLLFFSFLLLLTSCSDQIKGEGDAQLAQDFMVENFSDIEASGKFKLLLIPNDSAYVSVQSHRNLIENMDIYVRNKTLTIAEKKNVDSFESYVIYLYYTNELKSIEISEKVLLESASTLTFDKFKISAKDQAVVQQFVLNAKEVDLKVDDKAEVRISGTASTVDLKAKDYASVEIESLPTKVLKVDLSGEAEVMANVNKELKGRVLQNSTLRYIGSAVKDVDVKDKGEIINK
ncbi:MAG: DUF2807 domain-containing protein [Flavobacteriaceae bacterium]|nr:DUF2807 domain-containing protein [Flavobacteriaceae bacterium]